MIKPIRVGLLGTGYMSIKAYLPALRRQGAIVQGIWGHNIQNTARIAEDHNISMVFNTQEDLIFDPNIDAVIIATPNSLHSQALKAAATAKKAVACEKPIGMDMVEAKMMLNQAKISGIPHAVPYLWRLPKHVQNIKTEIDNGFIGRVFEFHAVFTASFLASADSQMGWRSKQELAGNGVLSDLGGHLFDLGNQFNGEIDQIISQGTTHIPFRNSYKEKIEEVTVIDSCNALLKFKNGSQGSLQMSYVNLSRNMLIRIEIHGSNGALLYELEMKSDQLHTRLGRVKLNHEDQIEWESKTQEFSEIIDQFCSSFLKKVRQEDNDLPDLRDGLRCQLMIDTSSRSLESGCWESVDYSDLDSLHNNK